jgi:hypothetical protein
VTNDPYFAPRRYLALRVLPDPVEALSGIRSLSDDRQSVEWTSQLPFAVSLSSGGKAGWTGCRECKEAEKD